MSHTHPALTDTLPTAILAAAVSLAARDADRDADARLDILLSTRTDRSERTDRTAARRYAAGRTMDRARRARLPYSPPILIICDEDDCPSLYSACQED